MSIQRTGLLSAFPTDIQKEILLKVENASDIGHLQLTSKADKEAVDRVLPLLKKNFLKEEGLKMMPFILEHAELQEHEWSLWSGGTEGYGYETTYKNLQSTFIKYIAKYQNAFPLSPVTNQANSPAFMVKVASLSSSRGRFNHMSHNFGAKFAFQQIWGALQDASTGLIDVEKADKDHNCNVTRLHNCYVMQQRIQDTLDALDKMQLS